MLLRNQRGSVVPVRGTLRGVASSAPWTDTNPLRFRLLEGMAMSGVTVGPDNAFSLPALLESVRQPAQLIALLDWNSWDWTAPAVPVLDTQSWQAQLLENPGFGSKFDLFQDISSSIDGWGGAFVQKLKGTTGKYRGQVIGLKVIDPDQVQVKLKDGAKVFEVKVYNTSGGRTSETVTMDTTQILHIRGYAHRGFLAGLVPFDLFRNSIGNVLAIENFSANWWKNSGTMSQIITHPDKLNPTQAQQILDIFDESHTGLENAGKPGLISGGAKLETVQVTAEDAQLIASRDWGVAEMARAMDWPAELLTEGADQAKTEEVMLKLKTVYLKPRARRIRDAFNADPDLFQGYKYWLDVRYSELAAADAMTQGRANLFNRQAGIMTANEIRVPMGLPPREDGDSLQLTPVGGAANPSLQDSEEK